MRTSLPIVTDASRERNKGRVQFVLAGMIFKVALDVAYATFLTNAFANHFLTPFVINFDLLQYVESFVWIAFVLALVPFVSTSAGGLAFFCAVVFFYAPVATIYGMDAERSRYTLFLSTIAVVTALLVSEVHWGRQVKITLPRHGEGVVLIVCFFFVGLFLMVAALSGALFSMNFAIDRVYEFRSELGSRVDVSLFSYTNLWAQKVFTPLILVVGLRRKSLWLICFALGMYLIYFGVTQLRMHLFAPILVYVGFLLYRRDFSFAKGFVFLASTIIAANLIILAYNLEQVGALAIRRAFFVGPSVAYSWVEYFSENPKVFFADNLLGDFVRNQYTGVNLPRFMGDVMRYDMAIAFNSGLVGAGFAQLGLFGVVLYGSIIGILIRINRRLIEAGVPPYISAAVLFLPYRNAWADADIFTALLSHGLIVGTFAVWLYGRTSYKIAPSLKASIKRGLR